MSSFGKAETSTTRTFLTALATNGAIAGAEFVLFLAIRRVIKAVYEPRTYIPPRVDQAKPLNPGIFAVLWQIVKADPKEVLEKNGVDPYVFLRFLRMLAKALVPIWLLSWAILLPVDSAGNVLATDALDRFTFGNVAKNHQSRYWAHLILVYVFNAWFMYLMRREMNVWLKIRQAYLIDPKHSKLAQASTVLITGVPTHLMDERALGQLFSHLPGGVRRIWLTRNLKDMPELWERRNKACAQLESAQVKLLKIAGKRQHDLAKKAGKLHKKGHKIPDSFNDPANPRPENGEELSLADEFVPRNKRPMIRLKPKWAPFSLGFLGIGKKVDAIDWLRNEIAVTTAGLDEQRAKLHEDVESPGMDADTYAPLSSAFIQFHQQIAAHMARQCLSYNQPYRMNRRFIEQSPSNVIWANMRLNEYEVNVRTALSWAFFIGLIIAWSPISAFIAALSSVTSLTEQFKWLGWINGDSFGKKLLQGVITGVLPPLLQMLLIVMILPIVLRTLSKLQGTVSKTEVELDIMTRYFVFLIIHVFLVTTLANGLIESIEPIIKDPTSIVTILKDNMPKASTFFITRILLQFTGTIGNLLQPISLLLYYIRVTLGGGTPRSIFNSRYQMPEILYGSEFPSVTAYACIMIAYMVISPIINGFGAMFSLLSYLVYKYLFIWVVDQRPQMDTGGLFFPKAMAQLFVGLYIQEVCLAALFFFARDDRNRVSALPQAILMIILIFITFVVNWYIKRAYQPMEIPLPLSMARLSYGMPAPADDCAKKSCEMYAATAAPPGVQPPADDMPTSEKQRTIEAGFADFSVPNRPQEHVSLPQPETASFVESPGIIQPTAEHADGIEMAELGGNAANAPERRTRRASRRSSFAASLGPHAEGDGCDIEDEPKVDEEKQYFARPGGPGVLLDAPDDANDPAAFFHPASKEPQRIVWIPQDELGLGNDQVLGNIAAGVKSSDKDAVISKIGHVRITGIPPDTTVEVAEATGKVAPTV